MLEGSKKRMSINRFLLPSYLLKAFLLFKVDGFCWAALGSFFRGLFKLTGNWVFISFRQPVILQLEDFRTDVWASSTPDARIFVYFSKHYVPPSTDLGIILP